MKNAELRNSKTNCLKISRTKNESKQFEHCSKTMQKNEQIRMTMLKTSLSRKISSKSIKSNLFVLLNTNISTKIKKIQRKQNANTITI